MGKTQENVNIYVCDICNFNSSNKYDYNRHMSTAKHKNRTNRTLIEQQSSCSFTCDCGKKYKARNSLWYHKQKCPSQDQNEPPIEPENVGQSSPDTASLLVMFKDMLAKMAEKDKQMAEKDKQMADLQTTMKEMIPKIGNNNNSNNKFNLQMFLNTDCKNAINLTDFIKTIQLEMNDMLHIGNTGYVEGISDIFIGALNKLQITERPIHCTDVRRDTLYIKENDHWDKSDAENPVLRKAIHHIDGQNQHLLPKWMEENPDSQHLDTPENIQLMKMFANSLGQGEEQSKLTKKIMKKILPRVALSKESAIQE